MRSRQGRRRLSAHEVSPLQDIELLRIVWFFQTAPLQQRWFSFTGAAFYGYGAIKKTDKVFGNGHFKTGPGNRVLVNRSFTSPLPERLFTSKGTLPFSGVNFTAFDKRLIIIWFMRIASPSSSSSNFVYRRFKFQSACSRLGINDGCNI